MSLFFFLGSPGSQFQTYFGLTRELDPADWGSPTFVLEVHGFTNVPAFHYQARLYNVTDDEPVSGSEIDSSASVLTRLDSSPFTLPSGLKVYEVQHGGVVGATYETKDTGLWVSPA